MDHDATERANAADLKQEHVLLLWAILEKHDMTDLLDPHMLHCHFDIHEGEIIVHRDLHVAGKDNNMPTKIGIAKMMKVAKSVKNSLVPLLWMVPTEGNLVAYEFGIKETLNVVDTKLKQISGDVWLPFIQEFASYVQSNGLADIFSPKNRGRLNGGVYVSLSQRALFRIPEAHVTLQPGSRNLKSGWVFLKGDLQPSDGQVTKTRQTSASTAAHYHVSEKVGPNAVDPAGVAQCYTEAMWAVQKSEAFWMSGVAPTMVAP